MERNERWQDWMILTLGVWLFLAPFFMAYASLAGAAGWNSYIVGGFIAISAASALWWPAPKAPEWINLVLGLWLVAAPFVFGFYGTEAAAAWNLIAVGILVAGEAAWALAARPADGAHAPHH